MIFQFGEFELDEELYELRRRQHPVPIEPKAFDVLRHLVHHRDRVVTKNELLDSLWPGEHVTESVLPRSVNAVRAALGEDAASAAHVATLRGRGYRFVATVEERGNEAAAAEPASNAEEHHPGRSEGDLFLGRDDTMAQLRSALEHVLAGKGRAVLIEGQAGIGKTTSFERLAAHARSAGARVVTGRCYESEGAPAFWPWTQILRGCLEGSPNPAPPSLAGLLPEVAESGKATHETSPEEARFGLFAAAARLLSETAREQPLVVGLEDLHWADVSSLLLLDFVVRELSPEPLLIVVTCRELELALTHPLVQTLGEMARQPHVRRLALAGLPEAEVGRFLAEVLGRPSRRVIATAVREKTEGNPFFIREVARLLTDTDAEDVEAQLAAVRLGMPRSVREAVARRLAILPEACRDLLTLGAVVGREFSVELLAQVTSLAEEEIWSRLEPALAARVLLHAPGAGLRCGFSHALVAEALYHDVPPHRRPALHLEVAQGLEKLYADQPEGILSELALHFYAGVPRVPIEKAVDYGLRAAEQASRRLAYEDAATTYERTLELLDRGTAGMQEERLELLLQLGLEHLRAGHQERSREVCERAADVARELNRPRDLARAALGCAGWSESAGQPDASLAQALAEALEGLEPEDADLRVKLLGRLAGTDRYFRTREARALTAEAVAIARKLDDPVAQCEALADRLVSLQGLDELEAWLELSNECLALATQTDSHPIRLRTHWYRFGAHLMRGDTQAAELELEAHSQLTQELRVVIPTALEARMRASRAMMAGEREQAVGHIQRAFSIDRRTGSPTAMRNFVAMTAWVLKDWEDLEQISGWFENSQEPHFGLAPRSIEAMHQLMLRELGRTDELRSRFELLFDENPATLSRDPQWLAFVANSSRLCASLGDRERGRVVQEMLEPYAGRHVVQNQLGTYAGPVDAYLGLLAELQGELDLAVSTLEKALVQCERANAVLYATRTREDLARVLRARGSPHDLDRCRSLAAEAAEAASTLGLERLEARARALLA